MNRIQNWQDVKVRKFEFLRVEKDCENIAQVMRFCGVEDKDIEQELIYHNGGDPYLIKNDTDAYSAAGCILIKFSDSDSIEVLNESLFFQFFEPL